MAQRLVAIVGAGPAGLFVAGDLAKAGCDVVLLNRDIKPGGLVEYGVFPTKYRFKGGLRRQFHKTLSREGVHYRGRVMVGQDAALTVADLEAIGFDAILLAVGAQGTKLIGIPGERGDGVYHAKDLVYHYNRLPPFSGRVYPIGPRVVVIGVGNVMVDIVNWLNHFVQRELDDEIEVVALSRTVPRFRKWVDKELKDIATAIDVDSMAAEVERLRGELERVGEEPDEDLKALVKYAAPADERSRTRWWVKWLVQPAEVQRDEDGRCVGLLVHHLRPEAREGGGRPKVQMTGETELIPADNVVLAVGDIVDLRFGLPAHTWGFRTWDELEEGGDPYRLVNADMTGPSDNMFVVGWAREASSGLVGNARKDARMAARSILGFLEGRAEAERSVSARLDLLDAALEERGLGVIDYGMVGRLEGEERSRAEANPEDELEGKFISDAEMLALLAGG